MKLIKLIPNIFYADIQVGLNLFVDCLGFELVYKDVDTKQPLFIIKRDWVAGQNYNRGNYSAKISSNE